MSDPLGLISNAVNQPIQGIKPLGTDAARGAQAISGGGGSFKDALMSEIDQVNKLQTEAAHAIEDWQSGQRDDYANVMLAKNKADVAFQLLMQVRNKMISAYEEIKQMRV